MKEEFNIEEIKHYSKLDQYFDYINISEHTLKEVLEEINEEIQSIDDELRTMKENVFADNEEENIYMKDVYFPKINRMLKLKLGLLNKNIKGLKEQFEKSLKLVFQKCDIKINNTGEDAFIPYINYAKDNLKIQIDKNLYDSLHILYRMDIDELKSEEDLSKTYREVEEIYNEAVYFTASLLKESCDILYNKKHRK